MNCQDHLYRNIPPQALARRWFLKECGVGLGAIALGQLAGVPATLVRLPIRSRRSGRHFGRGRRTSSSCSWPVRRAIWSCSTTSRSWRSSTARCRRPNCSRATGPRSSIRTRSCWGRSSSSPSTAQCGAELSELLPHLAEVVDDIAIVKSMVTDAFNHAPGQILMSTGSQQFGKPSLGAWTLYGLGSESQNLPGFVVFSTGTKGPSGGNSNWGSGFLPTVYQGVHVPHERRPGAVSLESARRRRRAAARVARCDQRAQSPASGRGGRSGNRHADQLVRNGVPHAGQRAGGDRHLAGAGAHSRRCTAPSRASRRSPQRACWPGGWSSAACGSSKSFTKRGTSTATWCTTSRRTARTPTRPARRW